jgi:hypothetical protein
MGFGLGLIKEVDGALHISTRGRRLGIGGLAILGAVLTVTILVIENELSLFVLLIWAILGLFAVIDQVLWAIVPRIIIDPRTRSVVIGKVQFPWTDYTGVVRVFERTTGANKKWQPYSLHLVCADGARTRLARTPGPEEAQLLQHRVAHMLGVAMLPDEFSR